MKKIIKTIIVLFLLIMSPSVCLAVSDSSGEASNGGGYVTCSPNCEGINGAKYFAGVRITFVDKYGKAVSGSNGLSFDYETYIGAGKGGFNTVYNAYAGDRNKIAMASGGNYNAGTINERDVKKFSAVVAAYYNNLGSNYANGDPAPRKLLPTSGNTGGNIGESKGFTKEVEFFLSITKAGNIHYAENVNAFIKAIAEVSGGFDATKLQYQVQEGCNNGDEIFIIMEPLFFWSGLVNGSYQNYFGTLADSYHFAGGKILTTPGKMTDMARWMYYQREIPAFSKPGASGVGGISKNDIVIQSASDLLSKWGYGLVVDWANDPGENCQSCSYKDGKFSYNNKLYPGDLIVPSVFENVQDYAFSDRASGGAGCCDILGPQISSMPEEWQESYRKICKKDDNHDNNPDPDDEDCCTLDPIEPGWIDGRVNNCCEDGGTSEAHEYDLDKLFCRDGSLEVDYYKPKCNSTDYYLQEDTSLNDQYCEMYCTERVSVEIPGPITATSGRYFQLTATSYGTKSPYIEGFKRCRIRVHYDIWEEDYHKAVEKEIESYNKFQKEEAYNQMYDEAIKKATSKSVSSNITCTASCQVVYETTCSNGKNCKKSETISATPKTANCTVKYKYSTFNQFNYYSVKLNQGKRDNFTEYEIMINQSLKTDRKNPVTWGWDESDCNNKISSMSGTQTLTHSSGATCQATWSCIRSHSDTENAEAAIKEDVQSKKSEYERAANSAKTAYDAAAREAKQLETDLDRCDNYFTKYEGVNGELNYNFDPSIKFSYTQVYMDNDRGLQMDEQYIQFKDTPGCVVSAPTAGPDTVDKLADKRYSRKIGTGVEKLVDFKEGGLQYYSNANGYKNSFDAIYNADKLYTHDAKYRVQCSWDEGENVFYTLSPTGYVSESTDVINFKEHGQEYRLHLTTLDGTYETNWQIEGLGSKNSNSSAGKFDEYFLSQGNTCANEDPSDTSMLTCNVHVEYEILLTGYCNGSNGTNTTVDPGSCESYSEGYNLFSFKVVDPENLFPNGYSTDNGTVGYNWSSTEAGQNALKTIEEKGKAIKTYARENLSYSFMLSPSDMGHIKNYNSQATSNGGYLDFNMNCDCSGSACKNCKSVFLNELANGNVTYDGQSHSVTGWSNQESNIDGIRKKYGW